MFGYKKVECEIEVHQKDQNSLSAALKRSKKEQKELDEIHEKKVINLELKLGDLIEFKNQDQNVGE